MRSRQVKSVTRTMNGPKVLIKKKKKDKLSKRNTKSQLETSFKKLKSTTDVEEARKLADFIVQNYDGSHLDPLSAVATLARFPGTFDNAVDHVFTCLDRVCGYPHQPFDFWASIMRCAGATARFIKTCDDTLAQIMCTEWARLSKDGRETEISPLALHARIEAFWAHLMKIKPITGRLWYDLSSMRWAEPRWPDSSLIFSTSLVLLKLIERRRIAVLKVNRVVGAFLPLELANLIKDHLHEGEELLNVTRSCSFEAEDTHTIRARVVCRSPACRALIKKGDELALAEYNFNHTFYCHLKCGTLGSFQNVTNLSVGTKHLIIWKESDRKAWLEEERKIRAQRRSSD